jgi:hypothetical protein
MARTSKKSASASAAPAEILVVVNKTEKATSEINALSIPTVSVAEIVASGSVMSHLCLNILAGITDKTILEAHAKRGGLKRLFPAMANADANALRICLDTPRAKLLAGWQSYTASTKRVRAISLQAMAKSIREKETDVKVSLREALTAWCADAKNQAIMDVKGFPQSLYDIFADFELIAGEEEAE